MIFPKRILFISHDASRSGAPIVLLHLLRWLKANSDIEFDVLLKAGGEMEAEFSKICTVYFNETELRARKFPSKLFFPNYRVSGRKGIESLYENHYDLLYFNTIAANDLISFLKARFSCPVICHVHENPFTIKTYYAQHIHPDIVRSIDFFIAASETTKEGLIRDFAVKESNVELCYEFIDLKNFDVDRNSVEMRHQLGIRPESFVVGASGTCEWRKGTDMFIPLAQLVREMDSSADIRFVWVGEITEEHRARINYDLERLDLTGQVIFTGRKKRPLEYFDIFNLFVLLSREDPFPLVCLEAAALSKPILCFEEAGGMPEFVREGAGIVFPYGRISEMAKIIVELFKNKQEVTGLSEAACKLVQRYDVCEAGMRILEIIKNVKSPLRLAANN